MEFFKRYNRTIITTFVAVTFLSISLFVFQFQTLYVHEISSIRDQFNQNASNLDALLKATLDHVEVLKTQAESELVLQFEEGEPQSLLFKQLRNNFPSIGHYSLLPGGKAQQNGLISQLEGKGSFTASTDLENELATALRLNPTFKATIRNLPSATWVYYISQQSFINVYPRPIQDVGEIDQLKTSEPYTLGLPNNNPQRKYFWTKAYVDHAGQGLMVTSGAPVYEGDRFRGTVAIDVTLGILNTFVKNLIHPYGNLIIIGEENQLLAHPTLLESAQTVPSAEVVFPESIRSRLSQVLANSDVQQIRGYLLLSQSLHNAPWKIVFWVPRSAVITSLLAHTVLGTLVPLLGLGLMLAVANWVTRHQLVEPAQYLVNHIKNESRNLPASIPVVPAAWKPLFHTISYAFQENRNLLQKLETRVEERTQALQESNEQLIAEIAERTQVEHELQQKAQQLEQTLRQLQATQTQLIQTEKMSSLGQLVAGIAHEINNPVNFIHGNLNPAKHYIHDLLRLLHLYQHSYPQSTPAICSLTEEVDLEFLETDLPKLLNSIAIGTSRIQEIVRSLRTFSRLDEAEMKAADIHEGIDSTLLILKSRLKFKSSCNEISVIKNYGQLPKLDCYPGQLNQVFMNIINNAIDALEECPKFLHPSKEQDLETPTIKIDTHMVENQWIKICIADNGCGMTEKVSQHIFDPFFTTKPIGKGTGLGLSISYQIITEKHGGKLYCSSITGQGTEFVIQIPLHSRVPS